VVEGPVIRGRGRQVVLGLALLAVVVGSLLAAPGPEGLLGALLGALMLAIAIVDSDRYIIPNELTGAAVALALFRAGLVGPEAGLPGVIWAAFGAKEAVSVISMRPASENERKIYARPNIKKKGSVPAIFGMSAITPD
jgi:hypothetical protein